MNREKARSIIENLVERYTEHQKDYHLPDYNEQKTRQDFINPFFRALGWDIDNEKGDSEAYREVIYEDKVKVKGKAKAPDYGFRLMGSGNKRLFYLEAKKPAVKIKVHADSAYQLRRYGSSAQVPVSILTNFEDFIIYDCTRVPRVDDSATVARLKHIHFKDYAAEFDFIYDTFSHEAVTKGRFDKFVQGGAAKRGTDTLDKRFVQSLDEWRKYLATNIAQHNRKLNDEELNYAVQQTLDRLIFLRFCEDRSVEPYAQMQKVVAKGDAYKGLLHLFKEADAKYNSGLFDFEKDTITPHLKMDPKVVRNVINEMYYPDCNFEFSVMPVEILGNAYEQFLGKVIRILPSRAVRIEEKPEVRKAGGVYYTPQYIVEYIVKNTVGKLIEGKTPKEIEKIKIVDPACGSGSFLLGAFDYLLRYHTDWYHRNGFTAKKGKENPFTPQGTLSTHEKKRILRSSIYGVDLDANAVEVSKLSLLLKCMEGETEASMNQQMTLYHERVLPNLDDNIKDGNSLIDTDFYDTEIDLGYEKKIKPFSWQKAFPEVFKQGGFDAVVGNPPYGADFSQEQKKYILAKYPNQNYQLDSYLIFMEKSVNDLLKLDGKFGMIIPNPWLTNLLQKKLRKLIFKTVSVNEIVHFKKAVFPNVTVDTEIVLLTKSLRPKNEVIVTTVDKGRDLLLDQHKIIIHLQKEWLSDDGDAVNIFLDITGKNLQKRITKQTQPLEVFLDIYTGIKPYQVGKGNPKQMQKDVDNRVFDSDTKINKFYRKYLRGTDINRYIISPKEERFIKFGEWLAEPRPSANFNVPQKIFMRQTGDSLIATIDTNQLLCLNNIHVLIPKDENGVNLKVLLGVVNSKLLNWYYQSINPEKGEALAEVKKSIVSNLPIKYNVRTNTVKNDKEIIKHVDLLLSLNEELKEAKLPTRQEQIKQRIAHSEDRINRLVYELYELTEDEIKIIEESINA
jgi:type I restriction-modification system DNA methylase subunit